MKKLLLVVVLLVVGTGLWAQETFEGSHLRNLQTRQDCENYISFLISEETKLSKDIVIFVSEKTRAEERIVQSARDELPETPTKGSCWIVVHGKSTKGKADYYIFFYADQDGYIYHWLYRIIQNKNILLEKK